MSSELEQKTVRVQLDRTIEQDRLMKEKEELTKQLALAEAKNAELEEQMKDEAEKANEYVKEEPKQAKGNVPLTYTEGGKYMAGHESEDPQYEVKRSFGNWGEAIAYLHAEEKRGNQDAHVILNRLTARTLNSMSEKPTCYSLESSLTDLLQGKGKFKQKTPSDSQTEDTELAS